MDASDYDNKSFSDIVALFKSWVLGWRSNPTNLSRDFWMPDHICRVCYDCDSNFTLFNRRHHCRLCGRVFCSACTSNWLPVITSTHPNTTSIEQWDNNSNININKIRVCNYCFKQWEDKGLTPAVNDHTTLDLNSSSPSVTSFVSTKSSSTAHSTGTTTAVSVQQSIDSHKLNTWPSGQKSAAEMENTAQERGVLSPRTTGDRETDVIELSAKPFVYRSNRSDEDDDGDTDEEFRVSPRGPKIGDFPSVSEYYGQVQFDDIDRNYRSKKVHPDGEGTKTKIINSPSLHNSYDSQDSEGAQQLVKSGEHDNADECGASSSLYAAESVEYEPVDFENNGVLWIPPEPEDEEDEKEAFLYDDDDGDGGGDATGEWGYLRSSSSFGSGEYRNREKSNEEHKKVMKNVVDGHFRALVAQLLQVENLPMGEVDEKENWLEIITSLSWEAASILRPDMSKSGGMDPGGYVKIKCLASGYRYESMVVKGVVCKKNVANRRMTSNIEKPRLLILGGALEYQRVSNLLSSFDTLLQQEKDHLKMAVAKIDAHKPDVLLVEKSVTRYAQDYLLEKNISLVLNIKRPLLERIARCTGGQIVPSIDHLSSPKLGYCDNFHVDKFLEEHGTAGQSGKKLVKTLMYFEGCPKPFGCTILLRGANVDELKKVKHVVQYGVFAAYHLALETSFLADEGASLPELPLNSPLTVVLPDKPSSIDKSISTIPGFAVPANEKTKGTQYCVEPLRSNSVPTSSLVSRITMPTVSSDPSLQYANLTSNYDKSASALSSISSCAPAVTDSIVRDPFPPHVSMEKKIMGLNESYEGKPSLTNNDPNIIGDCHPANCFSLPEALKDSFIVHDSQSESNDVVANQNPIPFQGDIKNDRDEHSILKDEFLPSPSDHQSILVSLSSRCVWKGTVCERSHLFRIKYYGNFDKPLGSFLRDNLFDQSYRCRSCEMPSEAHVHCYTHRQGTLTISVKKLPEFQLPGEKEVKIWMWHRCLRCPRTNGFPPATRRIVMSDAAWGLSFGKFLELSFSNHAAASRVASCGHSLHRDCLRFYGFGKMVACFRYASIDVHSVYLPPSKLDFNFKNQDWIQRELDEVVDRAELLFSEVLNSTSSLNSSAKNHESRRRLVDLEGMMHKEKSELEELVQKISDQDSQKKQAAFDIFEINRLRRQLAFQSYMWDHRLVYAASLDVKSFQKDLCDSTTEHEEKFLFASEKLANMNKPVTSHKGSVDCESNLVDSKLNQSYQEGEYITPQEPEIDHQGTDKCLDSRHEKEIQTKFSSGMEICDESISFEFSSAVSRDKLDGQVLITPSLSDTLDAAWTGEHHPETGTPPSDLDLSGTRSIAEKFHFEEKVEYQSGSRISRALPLASTKASDNMEDSVSWLGLPFLNFYRSLNKNFIGSDQKLGTLNEYNPVFISSFRESELQCGARLLLPVGVNDTVVPVYDDEPTSIISYALLSPEYASQLSDEFERPKDSAESSLHMHSFDSMSFQSFHSTNEIVLESFRSLGSADESILSLSGSRSSFVLDPLSYTKALHARVSFGDDGPLGKVKYTVTCYYAKRFEDLRNMCCPSEIDYAKSLSRCKKWGAQGGKSNVFFAKTLDDRFIIKQVTKTELESFIKFAPGYFKYLSESIGTRSPTCLAKILGIYQVTSKHLKGGKEIKMDVLVMENLLFGRNLTRLYDLKGSSRSRYNPDSSGSNKVLLDQNLIEAMPTSPIFVGNKAKRLLERAVWNDTAFLASIDVMDYSLLVGVDEEKHELVLGIIDFMRQYTWDKHLETWVKASGILGGPKNASPTVISPKQYKKRFRKAMTMYFLMVPDQWSPPTIIPSKSQTDLCENTQGATYAV